MAFNNLGQNQVTSFDTFVHIFHTHFDCQLTRSHIHIHFTLQSITPHGNTILSLSLCLVHTLREREIGTSSLTLLTHTLSHSQSLSFSLTQTLNFHSHSDGHIHALNLSGAVAFRWSLDCSFVVGERFFAILVSRIYS